MVLPTCVLAWFQSSWRAAFLARHSAQQPARPALLQGLWAGLSPVNMCTLVLAVGCSLWIAMEAWASWLLLGGPDAAPLN
jgi:hypothetical protein